MKLSVSAELFLRKALGDDGLDALQKTDLFKLKSGKVIDHEEIRTAIQIVPRTIMAFLQKELGEMSAGQNKRVDLPVEPVSSLSVTKHENDVYTGDISSSGKILAQFRDRSLPGVGLIVMSTFELYDVPSLAQPGPAVDDDKIQRIVDERLRTRDLIEQVVDKRITEREAINKLICLRLTQALSSETENKKENPEPPRPPMSKKLKAFIEKRSDKSPKEFQVQMGKSESVACEDCGKEIFSKGAYSGCICYGDDRKNKVFIKKNENGFSMKFPKSWDAENVQMLLETLRNKNRGSK